jgi:hypothetical protein
MLQEQETLADKIMFQQAQRGLKYDHLQELLNSTDEEGQISTTDPDCPLHDFAWQCD